jgi:hypothetical protein
MTATIDDVVDRLRAIRDAAPIGDGVRPFAAVYLTTTEAIRDRLRAGFFEDPATVERFDVVFAGRFFVAEAAAAGSLPEPVPRVWEPLFAARGDRRVQDVQFAVAGLNAHINHDLALSVVEVCAERGRDPDDPPFPVDYFRVTDVLVAIEAEVRQALLDELAGLDGPVEPLLHLVGSWSLASARAAAWVKAQAFWVTRRTRLLHDDLVRVSEGTVAMTTRHLLTPLFPATPA